MKNRIGRTRKCKCGAQMIPVIYGLPGGEMFEAAERGEIELGGCMIYPDAPKFICPECRREKRK